VWQSEYVRHLIELFKKYIIEKFLGISNMEITEQIKTDILNNPEETLLILQGYQKIYDEKIDFIKKEFPEVIKQINDNRIKLRPNIESWRGFKFMNSDIKLDENNQFQYRFGFHNLKFNSHIYINDKLVLVDFKNYLQNEIGNISKDFDIDNDVNISNRIKEEIEKLLKIINAFKKK
jgi:hypothetical protein